MIERGQPGQGVILQALHNATSGGGTIGSGATGQAGNITSLLYKDWATAGTAPTTANPVELGANGKYLQALSSAETDCINLVIDPTCSTATVEVLAEQIQITSENFSYMGFSSTGALTTCTTNTDMISGFATTSQGEAIEAKIDALSFATTGQGDAIQADIAALSFATTGQTDTINTNIAALSFATTSQAGSIETKIDSLISTAGVQTSCAAALVSYDPPTRTELTTDKEEILAGITAGTGSTAASITAATDVIAANITAGTGTIQTDIAALNNLSSSEVSTTVSALLVSTPITSGGAPTGATFGDYIMKTKYVIVNDLDIDEATGEAIVNNDAGDSVSTTGTFTTLAGITSRTKLI